MKTYVKETSWCFLKMVTYCCFFISVLMAAVLKITVFIVSNDGIANYILLLPTAGFLPPSPGASSLQEIGC